MGATGLQGSEAVSLARRAEICACRAASPATRVTSSPAFWLTGGCLKLSMGGEGGTVEVCCWRC